MYTQCPECQTIYALTASELAQARGSVACGHCGATFDGLASLAEALPPEPFDALERHPGSPSPAMLISAVYRPGAAQDTPAEPLPAASDGSGVMHPSFARRTRRRRAGSGMRWALGCLVLTLVLTAQLTWAERAHWGEFPAARGFAQQLCDRLGCNLPPTRDLAQLQMVSRDIRPHPSVPGALIISATMRNDAGFTQPYPVVSITLSDLNEHRVAMRRFRPSEYIADPQVRAAGLAPGASAALVFEVKDPGHRAVAFEFAFR
ncbi:zinc-ribbon and DUF3426 domain-containing protein [Oleiagrimonas sp. C23AA]|uniref:zinc-ribbon and DUF3426 domain-containing protein n=1 Tax=Oleiagrimonas sp. C23AA TaxID=2719047 RepID=UPI0014247579|nr:zinc-ribbon and DUF3426 domain-containing protein [Oleiagrimonas sp. C23AA]NII12313.1 DUF3426 domain-containing protein [Oleiagrimonas sp. C23AA]